MLTFQEACLVALLVHPQAQQGLEVEDPCHPTAAPGPQGHALGHEALADHASCQDQGHDHHSSALIDPSLFLPAHWQLVCIQGLASDDMCEKTCPNSMHVKCSIGNIPLTLNPNSMAPIPRLCNMHTTAIYTTSACVQELMMHHGSSWSAGICRWA